MVLNKNCTGLWWFGISIAINIDDCYLKVLPDEKMRLVIPIRFLKWSGCKLEKWKKDIGGYLFIVNAIISYGDSSFFSWVLCILAISFVDNQLIFVFSLTSSFLVSNLFLLNPPSITLLFNFPFLSFPMSSLSFTTYTQTQLFQCFILVIFLQFDKFYLVYLPLPPKQRIHMLPFYIICLIGNNIL